jgi:hypothetical protein
MRSALRLALVLLAFTSPARAHRIEYDTGAICDTQNQAERLAMLDINGEITEACAVEKVAFVRGAVLGTARNKAESFAVVEILVVGLDLGSGFRPVEPKVYFKLDKIDERRA